MHVLKYKQVSFKLQRCETHEHLPFRTYMRPSFYLTSEQHCRVARVGLLIFSNMSHLAECNVNVFVDPIILYFLMQSTTQDKAVQQSESIQHVFVLSAGSLSVLKNTSFLFERACLFSPDWAPLSSNEWNVNAVVVVLLARHENMLNSSSLLFKLIWACLTCACWSVFETGCI